ncbi:MAG: endonuclease domain-containing protein [Pyrinomonadaceae bacterium]|nr:endonuclease domain-containing protein [Pyrinomonadaceae bacterium]
MRSNNSQQIHNRKRLKTFRKALRNNLTPAEAGFWNLVKNKKLDGRKFRRQHSVGNYILDFYCPAERIAIELDGEGHYQDDKRVYDFARRKYLESLEIRVLRFQNRLVFEDPEWVLGVIRLNFGWRATQNADFTDKE